LARRVNRVELNRPAPLWSGVAYQAMGIVSEPWGERKGFRGARGRATLSAFWRKRQRNASAGRILGETQCPWAESFCRPAVTPCRIGLPWVPLRAGSNGRAP